MSETPAAIPREEEVLAEHMELELAAARRVHAKLMAAEEVDDINSLGRTWQRVARSLRQSVALKLKATRDREAVDAARAAEAAQAASPLASSSHPDLVILTPAQRARIDAAVVAVRRRLERERPDWDEFVEIEACEVLIDLAQEAGFMDLPLDDLVDRVVARLASAFDDDDLSDAPPEDLPDDADAPAPAVQDSG